MSQIVELLKKPNAAMLIGAVGGLLLGLLFGWVIWPVEWTNATPEVLRTDIQQDYLRMAIDSFDTNANAELAIKRWNQLGEFAPAALAAIVNDPAGQDPIAIANFAKLMPNEGGAFVDQATEMSEQPSMARSVFMAMAVFIGVVAVLGVVYTAVRLLRTQRSSVMTPARQAREFTRQAQAQQAQSEEYESRGQAPPVAQFVTTYVLGDDLFDDSFSIESPGGDFMGECGVGISDTIGVGDPKKVSAFEIWLFDKNDIQTITKVIMSENAFNDPLVRQRLESKGEPKLALPQEQVILETETLQLIARISDVAYGSGALPAKSYFERMTLELVIWSKI